MINSGQGFVGHVITVNENGGFLVGKRRRNALFSAQLPQFGGIIFGIVCRSGGTPISEVKKTQTELRRKGDVMSLMTTESE